MDINSKSHIPVLAQEICQFSFEAKEHNSLYDGTYGRGGHTKMIFEACQLQTIHAVDKDPTAIAHAENLAKELGDSVEMKIHHGSFDEFSTFLGSEKVNLVLLDLGVSSPQIDDADRGFSFNKPGPLDMRMDNSKGVSVEELIAKTSEEDLADMIFTYGEETQSRKISKAIQHAKKQQRITDTLTLARIVESVVPRFGKNHPATKTFQALRIVVNQELQHIENALDNVLDFLTPGGRVLIISFHSLEDRIVKQKFKTWKKSKLGSILTKKCVSAEMSEIRMNKRSRSAKLRCFEKSYE